MQKQWQLMLIFTSKSSHPKTSGLTFKPFKCSWTLQKAKLTIKTKKTTGQIWNTYFYTQEGWFVSNRKIKKSSCYEKNTLGSTQRRFQLILIYNNRQKKLFTLKNDTKLLFFQQYENHEKYSDSAVHSVFCLLLKNNKIFMFLLCSFTIVLRKLKMR